MKSEETSEFEKLFKLDVNSKTEKKNNLTYLSWAWAWAEFVKVYPEARYEVVKNDNMMPYFKDESGAFCYTRVTAGGITHEMWLPVMDYKNQTIKNPTAFDVNKTIMRCLTKNLAMFGLGLYIYAGEDLPESDEPAANKKAPTPSKATLSEAEALMNEFKEKLSHYDIDPRKFLERDGVDMNDPKKIYATVRQYMGMAPDLFVNVLEEWEE